MLRFFVAGLLVALLSACASNPEQDEAAVEEPKADIEVYLASAGKALQTEQYALAISNFEQAVAAGHELAKVAPQLGYSYSRLGDYPRAKRMYELVLEATPDDAAALKGRAVAELKLGNVELAQTEFAKLLEQDAACVSCLSYLGVIADLNSDFAQAESYYKRALELAPDDPTIYNNYGYSRLMARQYGEAQPLLEKALMLADGEAPRVKNNLSISYAWQRDYQKAISILSPAMNDPVVYNNVGYIAMLNGDIGKSIQFFEKAMTLSPSYYERAATNLAKAKQLLEPELVPGAE